MMGPRGGEGGRREQSVRALPRRLPGSALLLSAALLAGGCREHVLSIVEVATVEIVGVPSAAVPPGDTLRLSAVYRSIEGRELTAREVEWSSSDTTIVRVTREGAAIPIRPGTTVIRARVEGRRGDAPIVVGEQAALSAPPTRLAHRATIGAVVADTIPLTNRGAGRIRDLRAAVEYAPGQLKGWLQATLSSESTPAQLILLLSAATLQPGRYSAVVEIRGFPEASLRLEVAFEVLTGISRWTVEHEALTTSPLNAVWRDASGVAYAVGIGTILRDSGSGWTPVWDSGVGYFQGVWGSSPDSVFVVGEAGDILRFNGRSWVSMEWDRSGALLGLGGRSAGDVYGVGYSGGIFHFDGQAWRPLQAPQFPRPTLYGVWTAPGAAAYAVGAEGTILRIQGSDVEAMPSGTGRNLRAVWGTSDANLIAVGDSGTILRFDGAAWRAMPSGTRENLTGVWGRDPDDVLVTGDRGTLLRFDGHAWRRVDSGTAAPLAGVSGNATGAVAVGVAGTIVSLDGGGARVVANGAALNDVWGAGRETVFAVGGYGLILKRGPTGWQEVESGTTHTLHGVWGTSSTDIFAVGAAGTILRFDGTRWRPIESGTTVTLNAVAGSSASDVWAVGEAGVVLHFDGSRWRTFRDWSSPHPAGIPNYTSIEVASPTEVVLLGWQVVQVFRNIMVARTLISRFDGTTWTEETIATGSSTGRYWASPGLFQAPDGALFGSGYPDLLLRLSGGGWLGEQLGEFRKVVGTSSSDVYALGETILHFDGARWRVARPEGRYILNGAWIDPDGQITAVGHGRSIIRGSR